MIGMAGPLKLAVVFLIICLHLPGVVEAKNEDNLMQEIDNIIEDDDLEEIPNETEEDFDEAPGNDDDDGVSEDLENEEEDNEGDEEEDPRKGSFGSTTVKNVTLPTYYDSCDECMCKLKITPIGCYHDTQTKRPLPLLLDSHRDVTSHAFHGEVFDWRNGEKSIRKLACDCAKKARKYGYSHFGLQFYGECWSSKTAALHYANNGKSKSCVNGKYKACNKGEFCVGQSMTNYVYRIDPLTKPGQLCKTKFEKVGCFHDPVKTKSRPLPELLDSHRDITSHVHHGHFVNWNYYRASLEKLICHCADKAKKKGHAYFGIEYYGECWSGKHSAKTYNKYGSSNNCVSTSFGKCDPKSDCLCAGKGFALFVYKVK